MSAQPESPQQTEAHRSWRRWAIGSTVVLLLMLVPVAGLHLYDGSLVAEGNHLIAELDRAEPGWRDSTPKADPLPADRDSMVVMRRVAALLPKHWDREIYDDVESRSSTSARRRACCRSEGEELVETALKRASAALILAKTLKDFPEGRLDMKPAKEGQPPGFPSESHAKDASRSPSF